MTAVIVAGNWKMNLGPREAEVFVDELVVRMHALLSEGDGWRGAAGETEGATGARSCQVVIFPPAVSLDAARARRDRLVESGRWGSAPALFLGIQQIHPEPHGAFTGETAAEHAAEAGAAFSLVGHSERRTLFHETDDQAVRRVQAAFRVGLHPLLCVGETLAERRAGRLEAVIHRQLDAVLSRPELRDRIRMSPFSVAYEPVWAIGTGETATPDDAAEAHAMLRQTLVERLGSGPGAGIPILYGGSVKPANADDLLAAPEVGGLLVGGASLTPGDFAALVAAGYRAAS